MSHAIVVQEKNINIVAALYKNKKANNINTKDPIKI